MATTVQKVEALCKIVGSGREHINEVVEILELALLAVRPAHRHPRVVARGPDGVVRGLAAVGGLPAWPAATGRRLTTM